MGTTQNALDFMIRKPWNDRGDHHTGWNASGRQYLQCRHPFGRRGGARFHGAGKLCVKRGDGNSHPHKIAFGHRAENIKVAGNKAGFRDNRYRMIMGIQHFQHLTHDPVAPFNRLIGIRVRPNGNGAYFISGFGKFPLKQRRGIGLGK